MVVKVENDDDDDIAIDLEELEGAISEEKELDFDVEDLEKYLDWLLKQSVSVHVCSYNINIKMKT